MKKRARPSLFSVLGSTLARSLHPSEKLILVYLSWRQGCNGAAWPGVDRIAADLGMDERLCRRSIDRLCAAGCIDKTPGRCGRGYSNQYAVLPEKRGQGTPISENQKGGIQPPLARKKRGRISQKKGAGNPLKEQGSNQKSSALRTSSARTNARKQSPKAKTAKAGTGQPFRPPTVDEVAAYADTRGVPDFDAAHFVRYYADRQWIKANGVPVQDWKGTVRTWIEEDNQRRVERGEPPMDGYSQYGTHPATEEEIEALQQAGVL